MVTVNDGWLVLENITMVEEGVERKNSWQCMGQNKSSDI